jgi:hypothetical protein
VPRKGHQPPALRMSDPTQICFRPKRLTGSFLVLPTSRSEIHLFGNGACGPPRGCCWRLMDAAWPPPAMSKRPGQRLGKARQLRQNVLVLLYRTVGWPLPALPSGEIGDGCPTQKSSELRHPARSLMDHEDRRKRFGSAALAYARANFEMNTIASRSEELFSRPPLTTGYSDRVRSNSGAVALSVRLR